MSGITAIPETSYSGVTLADIMSVLKQYLPQMGNYQLVADTGAVIGWLAPAMDAELGDMKRRKERFI